MAIDTSDLVRCAEHGTPGAGLGLRIGRVDTPCSFFLDIQHVPSLATTSVVIPMLVAW